LYISATPLMARLSLSVARGEDDFFGGSADQLGDALACGLYALLGRPPKGVVAAGRVAELLHEVRQHLLQHPRIHGRGGVVVHVDGQLDSVGGDVLLLGDRLYIRAHDGSPEKSRL
jgi:hypothetical protein